MDEHAANFTSIAQLAAIYQVDPVDYAESISQDAAKAFFISQTPGCFQDHIAFLRGTQHRTCSYLPRQNSIKGHSLIPFPVLKALCSDKDNDRPYKPNGIADALVILGRTLMRLYEQLDEDDVSSIAAHSRVKCLGPVFATSVLSYARAHGEFYLNDICQSFGEEIKTVAQ